MAKPVDQPGSLQLLEEAAHLLRRTPLDTLLCHWTGSVPFALALLIFWNIVTHPPVPDALCAAESLALALLLIWMNCWRSVYAGRIYRQLSGVAEKPWTPGRVRRLVANQAFLAASKLIVLPVSLVAGIPFASTVVFYRYASVLAGREALDPLAVIAKARRLERGDKLQSWLLQLLLLLLSLGAIVNIAVAFIILPQLVKALTGYESTFSRSGSSFFENRLFVVFVLATTWLIFDPFVQATYCLRCFQAESRETGDDLRAGLRQIGARAGRWAATALFLAILAAPLASRAADSVSPQELDQAVKQTMQSPAYNWRIPPPADASAGSSWIVAANRPSIGREGWLNASCVGWSEAWAFLPYRKAVRRLPPDCTGVCGS